MLRLGHISKHFVFTFYSPESERYYNFTELACQLNEPEEGVAPTDSRNRPDQRLMEEGFWDEANAEKVRLEEKQRLVRRQKETDAEKAAAEGWSYIFSELFMRCHGDANAKKLILMYFVQVDQFHRMNPFGFLKTKTH